MNDLYLEAFLAVAFLVDFIIRTLKKKKKKKSQNLVSEQNTHEGENAIDEAKTFFIQAQ